MHLSKFAIHILWTVKECYYTFCHTATKNIYSSKVKLLEDYKTTYN